MNAEIRRIVGNEMPIKLLKRGSWVSVVTSVQLDVVALSFADTSTHNAVGNKISGDCGQKTLYIPYPVPGKKWIIVMKIVKLMVD